MQLNVDPSDIAYAERILFGCTGRFDEERVAFISDFDTLDLQAVPGSGKTTVLLAKLLILERHLPLPEGQAVLILSHTNVAVDEIAERIAVHCPKLFGYPNFIGTIQSFVDQYLAIPFYEQRYRSGLVRIDNEIYEQVFMQNLNYCLSGRKKDVHRKILHIAQANPELLLSYRFDRVSGKTVMINKLNGKALAVSKPRGRTKVANYVDWSAGDKELVLEYLKALKVRCLAKGFLHYDDAYFLAKSYLELFPGLPALLCSRFPFVFVDEMQDMEAHQCELLETLFFDNNDKGCYQRIGDVNQCIYGNKSKDQSGWRHREKLLKISGSHRLSPKLANILCAFGTTMEVEVRGLRCGHDLGPHLIAFQKANIAQVIPTFAELILAYQRDGKITVSPEHPIKVIGWNGQNTEDDKLRINDYYPSYSVEVAKVKIDYQNLIDYLAVTKPETKSFGYLRKNILNAILKLIRLQGNIPFELTTRRKLINYLKFNFPDKYDDVNTVIYLASLDCLKSHPKMALSKLIAFLPDLFFEIFEVRLNALVMKFMHGEGTDDEEELIRPVQNQVVHKGLSMQIGSVHSVKGETHLATLYLDTCYNELESVKSLEQLKGKNVFGENGVRKRESAAMIYVGFSRATDLLCYAVPSDNLKAIEPEMEALGWTILKI